MFRFSKISVVLLCCSMATLHAASVWNGSVSSNWADAGNWTGGLPTTGSDVTLTDAGTFRPTNQNISPLSLNSITVTANTAFTVSGSSVTLTGATSITITAANTADHIFSFPITLGAGTSWAVGAGRTLTVSSVITGGANNLTTSATGTLILNNASLTTTGTLAVSANGALNISGTSTLNLANFHLGQATNLSGTVNQTGGTVTVSGQVRVGHFPTETSTYSISGGTLAITGTSGTNPFTTGATEQNGALYLGIDGTGIFNQTGGTVSAQGLVLDNRGDTNVGTDTYTISGSGILRLGTWGIQGNASTAVNFNGGTIEATAAWTGSRPVTLGAASTTTVDTAGGDITLSGLVSGTGGLTKAGSGTLILTGTGAHWSGATTVNAGTLRLGNPGGDGYKSESWLVKSGATLQYTAANVIVNTAVITAESGGTVNFNGSSDAIGYLAGAGSVTLGTGTATLDTPTIGSGSDFSGVISGTGGIIVRGGSASGTQIFSGTNTYSGATSIAGAKTLQIGNGGTTGTLGTGNVTIDGSLIFNRSNAHTVGNVISGAGSVIHNGTGAATLSAANTYSGATTVNAGTLNLTGARLATSPAGTITVQGGGILNISNGTLALGANNFFVGQNTNGTVNQTGGAVTFSSGNQLLIGNGTSGTGTYNLSGGSITTVASTSRGVILGVNTGTTGIFNLSGTGSLNMTAGGNAILQIGRSDSAANTTTSQFNQTGGTANVGILAIGGNGATGTGLTSSLDISAGTFSAASFTLLAAGDTNTANINIGGTASVTLPAFPTTRGTTSTATVTFDGGTLIPAAASATYMGGLTNAFVRSNGATININGLDITIAQALLTHGTSLGGSLTKTGTGTLTLSGANTFSGGVNLTGGIVTAGSNTALGSGTLTFSASAIRLVVNDGLTIANNIVIGANAGTTGRGLIENSGTGNATLSGGTITINNGAAAGGHFAGASTGSLTINHSITSSVNVVCRIGIVILGGGGSYTNFTIGQGTVRLGANGGIATNATASIATSGAGNLDLAGFNQSLAGIIKGANTAIIGSSSTTADSTLTITGTSTYAGIIQNVLGSGTRTVALTVNTTGTLTLSGANTYTGNTTVNAGTLAYGASNVIGTGAVTVNGATAILDLGTNQTDSVGTVTVANGGSITGTGTSALTSTGTFEMQSGSVSAILAGAGIPLNKTTTGTVSLSGANTYTGATTVNSGTLQVTGSTAAGSAVAVNSGGTLGGSGTVAGTVAVNAGGSLTPGTGGTTINTLSTGAVTFNATAAYNVDLEGTGPTGDRVTSTGAVVCAGTLTISSFSGTPSLSSVYTIASGTSVTGTFAGLADGTIFAQQGRVFQIFYTATAVTLTDVSNGFIVADASVNEDAGTVTITVTRLGSGSGAASVQAGTSSGTATAGADFTTTSATLNWANGVAGSMTFTVPILEDVLSEGAETFTVTLSNPAGGFILDGAATVTINDNEALPLISVVDGSVAEAAGTASVTVTLSGTSAQTVTVDLATSSGTATAGLDFTAATTTVTWLAGESGPKTVSVPIVSDLIDEADETVVLTLGAVSASATINDGNGILTILDDDIPPSAVNDSFTVGKDTFRILNVLANDGGLANAPITVSVVTPAANGTLVVNADNTITYTPASGYLGADSIVYRVTDSVGQTSVATVTINVTPAPVFVSQPVMAPNPAVAGALVLASAATDVGTIAWEWGDGSPAGSGAATNHVYSVPGTYTVTVTATSPDGAVSVTSLQIFVGIGLDGGTGVPGGGATPPGVTGILVGGAGAGAAQGGSGKVSCNYIRRDKTYYQGSIAQLGLPATLKQSDLALQFGTLVIGTGASAATFRFDLDERGRGKATGLPKIEFSVDKKRFKFKAQRADLTALTEVLGGPQEFVKTSAPVTLMVPVTVQVGTKLYLALTFQVRYKQISGKGTGSL